MKERYLKVLALFSVSTLIPTVLLNSKAIDNSAIKYVLRTALGYGILLQVYAIYQDLKHINSKLLSEIESCLHDTIFISLLPKNLSYSCFLKNI